MTPTILLVEDSPQCRQPLAKLLRHAGYETLCVQDGEGALEMLRVTQPALILLDLMMPVMCGVEFLKVLRQDPFRAETPVIVVTGVAPGDEAITQARSLGAK